LAIDYNALIGSGKIADRLSICVDVGKGPAEYSAERADVILRLWGLPQAAPGLRTR